MSGRTSSCCTARTPPSSSQAHAFLAARAAKLSLKSKNVSPGCIELNYEIRLRSADTDFVNELAAAPGVSHAVLVAYNGDYMG